jgi:glycosyltransferase involved in cell wall biosynthesis
MFVRNWTTSVRLVQFEQGLRWWATRPVAGIGLGRFLAESPRWFGQPYQIHNTFIWLLVETGLIGALWFSLFLLLVGDEFFVAARSAERRWWSVGLAAAFASALGFMVGNEGLYQRHLWLVVAAAGVIGGRASNHRLRGSGQPPSVIQVVTRLNVGGITQQVIVLAVELGRRGYVAEIAAGAPGPAEGDRRDAARAAGVRVHTLPHLSNRINPVRDVRAFLQLVRLFVRDRPDVVHLYMLKARLLGGLAARATGVPVVVETLHGNVLQGYYGRAASAAIRIGERVAGRLLVDRVIAVTSGQRDELLRFRVAPPERLVLQLPGMDVTPFRNLSDRKGALRRRLGVSEATLIVGTIGRLVPIKGLDVFLDAAARVADRSPRDLGFVIAGDGPLRQQLEAHRDRLGLGERCTFLGEISDIRGFYADCDLVVMSSRNEGAPIVLLEAMAAGKPVVATRVGGVPDMVEDGVSALLVPSDDSEALSAAIQQLVDDDGKRDRIAQAAWQRADRFSLAEFCSGTDRLYRELAS